ncbi:MAG: hypothetical protein K2P01_00045, partial [Oscillospiraceae bacterium]|nr:hypothetical protein [Oscillospiraceae bacterium]
RNVFPLVHCWPSSPSRRSSQYSTQTAPARQARFPFLSAVSGMRTQHTFVKRTLEKFNVLWYDKKHISFSGAEWNFS